jgi:2-hydroxychromene-2-carboxylate isomerase
MDMDMKHNLIQELLDAAWRHGKDISADKVVEGICTSVGLNGKLCVQRAKEETAVKDRLKTQTETAVAAGVFGVPTTSVNGELFWGSEVDTMNHIESAILGRDPLDPVVFERWRNITPSAVRKR